MDHLDTLQEMFGLDPHGITDLLREFVSNEVADESVSRKMSWEDVCDHVTAATGKPPTSDVDALAHLTTEEIAKVLHRMRA